MESQFSLLWNNYNSQITEAFGSLLLEQDLVDVTLSCEGKMIKAHKLLLSACSPYFHETFKGNPCQHPVIVFKNVKFIDLKAIVDFIYCGEVNVLQEQLESFLSTAEMLEVKGLTEREDESKGVRFQTEKENMQLEQDPINSTRKTCYLSSEPSGYSSPPAKKRKQNVEKADLTDESVEVLVVKEEPDDIEIVYEGVGPEVSNPVTPEVSTLDPKPLHQEEAADLKTLQDSAQESITKDEVQEIEDKSSIPKTASTEIKVVESKTSVPLKKRINTQKEEVVSNNDTIKLEQKIPDTKISARREAKQAENAKPAKGKAQIPKGLTVTSIKAKPVKDLFDFPTQEPQLVQDEAIRSEDATTPIHEELTQDPQNLINDNVPLGLNSEGEPELAEEAPVLQSEQTELEAPAVEEPEFDYFGCEICQSETKPVDLERIVFSHKCPICPCSFFCSHLLKEHMKIIHGWFNVQRRFTQY